MGRFTAAERATFQRNQPQKQTVAPKPAAPATSGAAMQGGGSMDKVGAPATGSTITTAADPNITAQLKRYNDRFKVDNTDRAINRAVLGATNAGALAAADSKGGMAARGIVGTSTGDTFMANKFLKPAADNAAKAATDIALGREGQLDALTLGGNELAKAPSQLALAAQGENRAQQGQTYQQNLSQAEFQAQQNNATMDRIMQMYGLASGTGAGVPSIPAGALGTGSPLIPGMPARPAAAAPAVHVGGTGGSYG